MSIPVTLPPRLQQRILQTACPRTGRLVVLCLIVLGAAGCGVAGSSAQSSTIRPSSFSYATRPCAGPPSAGSSLGRPSSTTPSAPPPGTALGAAALVLTPAQTSGSVRVGGIVQVQLPVTEHWDLASTTGSGSASSSQPPLTFNPSTPALQVLTPAGWYNAQAKLCIWSLRAQAAKDQTLIFTASALCTPGTTCVGYSRQEVFTIHVTL